ncbi:hypothetical protein Y032_0607g591 [Ancylostoma ceylanicum]|uniref:Uncharacterized protein n=1 Tax=Ancylostoma ceylanicum TaxID=53326 RepID=A0A016WL97_9BILA|nr:hypothetical protein Y032_0607g591 [Ancylostoma ceylanicum]
MSLEFNILSGSSLHLEQNLARKRLTVFQTPPLGEGHLRAQINPSEAGNYNIFAPCFQQQWFLFACL